MANSFCVICKNGGDSWICDEKDCKRVVCCKCLIVPEKSLKEVTEDHVTFKCVNCHWKETEKSAPQPYFGFYSQGKPVLPEPPVITGGFQHAINAQVAPHSTALIHLHLENLEVGHGQVNMIHSLLQPYFPKGRYQFSQLPFLTTQESLAVFINQQHLTWLPPSPHTRVSTCSSPPIVMRHQERGDLFAGFFDGVTVVSEVSEVLQAIFTPFTQIIKVAHIFFNVCGSGVTVEDSFNGLKKAAQLFKPKVHVISEHADFDKRHFLISWKPQPPSGAPPLSSDDPTDHSTCLLASFEAWDVSDIEDDALPHVQGQGGVVMPQFHPSLFLSLQLIQLAIAPAPAADDGHLEEKKAEKRGDDHSPQGTILTGGEWMRVTGTHGITAFQWTTAAPISPCILLSVF
ncbi:hypothetical protein EDC04DRAFT_2895364 [Pisolithus marmoratus]|nr:hypothetical protein EDC04DRAFT_2895364 [Pisolithus marmoratus]